MTGFSYKRREEAFMVKLLPPDEVLS